MELAVVEARRKYAAVAVVAAGASQRQVLLGPLPAPAAHLEARLRQRLQAVPAATRMRHAP